MIHSLIYGAALLVALLLASPALDRFHFKPWGDWKPQRIRWRDLVTSELGTVTVTYNIRGGGVTIKASTTPPTAAQAAQVQKQSAVVAFGATADVQALFTHNWGLDASAPTYYEPEILLYQLLDGTYAPSLTFDVTNTNVVAINKLGSNAPTTVLVVLRRPHAVGQ